MFRAVHSLISTIDLCNRANDVLECGGFCRCDQFGCQVTTWRRDDFRPDVFPSFCVESVESKWCRPSPPPLVLCECSRWRHYPNFRSPRRFSCIIQKWLGHLPWSASQVEVPGCKLFLSTRVEYFLHLMLVTWTTLKVNHKHLKWREKRKRKREDVFTVHEIWWLGETFRYSKKKHNVTLGKSLIHAAGTLW